MADLLRNADSTVTCCHSKTENLPEIVSQADILVVAARQPKLVKKDWVKAGAVIVDAGINSIPGKRRRQFVYNYNYYNNNFMSILTLWEGLHCVTVSCGGVHPR